MLKRTHFSELSILGLLHKRNPRLHTPFPNARSEKRKFQAQNDHKSNAASKHINCSSISIHYKLNLPRETDAKLQFASKSSSLNVSDGPRTHSLRRGENQRGNPLGNPASFANCASPATTPSLGINKFLLEPRVHVTVLSPARHSLHRRHGYQAGFQRSYVVVNVNSSR